MLNISVTVHIFLVETQKEHARRMGPGAAVSPCVSEVTSPLQGAKQL